MRQNFRLNVQEIARWSTKVQIFGEYHLLGYDVV
jgi:hypothetical protein